MSQEILQHADAVEHWEPRRALSLRQARRRSALVAGLRRLFTAAAGGAFASVFVFMALSSIEGGIGAASYAEEGALRMVNPRFTGRTDGGPFVITADTAVRQRGGDQLIELTSPVFRGDNGSIVLAPRAVYDEQAQKIVMDREVLFSEPGGNRFATPSMVIDLSAGTVRGEGGVTGAGPLGVFQAGAYEIRESDGAVVLQNGVRGVLPERSQAVPAGPEGQGARP